MAGNNNGVQYSTYSNTANNVINETSSLISIITKKKNDIEQKIAFVKIVKNCISCQSILLLVIGTCIGIVSTSLYSYFSYNNHNSNVPPFFPRLDIPPSSFISEQTLDSNVNTTSSSSSTNNEPITSKTRPVCTYYYPTVTTTTSSSSATTEKQQSKKRQPPKIIQTSMEEPSQPWSIVQCYPQVIVGSSSTSSKTSTSTTSTINAFDKPDAVLSIDFSNIPFKKNSNNNNPILGFGGAFTEASALNFNTLSTIGQELVLELLFGTNGLGYSLGRFPLNSCDFSVESYNFDSAVDDFDLVNFDTNVTHDVTLQLNFAKRALHIYNTAWGSSSSSESTDDSEETQTESNYETFKFFASPWSPPNWMKAPTWEDKPGALFAEKMTYSANPVCLRDGVGSESQYAAAWALYFSKFITAYEKHLQTKLWAVTVQNEPEFPAPWEACAYTPQNESEFIYYHLGPQLQKDHPHIRILGYDHNKEHIKEWVNGLVNTTHASVEHYQSSLPYIAGTAYHWYVGGMDRLLDGAFGTPNLHMVQSMLNELNVSDHIFFNSEACHCPTTGYAGGDIENYWSRGERYVHTILADLMAGSQGFVEWNLLLDSIGGPNHLGNLCDSTILAVPHRATNSTVIDPLPIFEHTKPMSDDGTTIIGDQRTLEELNAYGFNAKYIKDAGVVVQPLYYYMGHISRYVRPGSYVVSSLVNTNTGPGKIYQSKSNSVVAGGGLNDLARNGIEITVWPCEGSTRQHFTLMYNTNMTSRTNKMLQNHGMTLSTQIQVSGHDWLGNPTISCFPRTNRIDLMGLTLNDCTSSTAGMYDIIKIENDTYDRYYIKLLNPLPSVHNNKGNNNVIETQCLTILELANNGGAYGVRGGSQVAIGDCSHKSAKWIIDTEYGTISSLYFVTNDEKATTSTTDAAAVCMTTGWPFLQMGAFVREVQTPINDDNLKNDNKTDSTTTNNNNNTTTTTTITKIERTIVLLNEAREAANYIVRDESGVFFIDSSNVDTQDEDGTMIISGSIPPRSIQTIIL